MVTPSAGTKWRAKKADVRTPYVEVWRTTPNNVQYRDRATGQTHSVPISIFVGMYVPEDKPSKVTTDCERCGASDVKPGDKWCKACQRQVGMFRSAKAREESKPVLSTTSVAVIEERLKATPVQPTPPPPPSEPVPPPPGTTRWLIKGQVVTVTEQEFEVDATDALDALGVAAQAMPGMRVTSVNERKPAP